MINLRFNRKAADCTIDVDCALEKMLSKLSIQPTLLIVDHAISGLGMGALADIPRFEIQAGEELKSLSGVAPIFDALLERKQDKRSLVLIIGGGTVCDAGAFCCSVYQRGIPFALAPSTLLAQVDAAIGGKNAINLSGVKNLIGTVTQPTHVLCATDLVNSLPPQEISNGLAEMIKHGAICSAEYFEWLEENLEKIRALEQEALRTGILESIKIKASVVTSDESDNSSRMILNFGHTLGHAYEALCAMPHGAAVSLGMLGAAEISVRLGLFSRPEQERIERLLRRSGLPVAAPQVEKAQLLEKIIHDKKRRGNELNLVLLRKLGAAEIFPVPIAALEELVP